MRFASDHGRRSTRDRRATRSRGNEFTENLRFTDSCGRWEDVCKELVLLEAAREEVEESMHEEYTRYLHLCIAGVGSIGS